MSNKINNSYKIADYPIVLEKNFLNQYCYEQSQILHKKGDCNIPLFKITDNGYDNLYNLQFKDLIYTEKVLLPLDDILVYFDCNLEALEILVDIYNSHDIKFHIREPRVEFYYYESDIPLDSKVKACNVGITMKWEDYARILNSAYNYDICDENRSLECLSDLFIRRLKRFDRYGENIGSRSLYSRHTKEIVAHIVDIH